jgi:hypothetical protein
MCQALIGMRPGSRFDLDVDLNWLPFVDVFELLMRSAASPFHLTVASAFAPSRG